MNVTMLSFFKNKVAPLITVALFSCVRGFSQVENWQETHRGSIYFGLGYGKTIYSPAKVHVSQGSQTSYDLSGFTGTDQGPANAPTSMMQYRFVLGSFLNYRQSIGLELSYDPIRFYVADNQTVHVSGTIDGAAVSDNVAFARVYNYRYYLDNGSGLVKRFGLYRKVSHKFALDAIVKGGIGAMSASSLYEMGSKESVTKGASGMDIGVQGGIKWTTHRHFFLEGCYHFDYGSMSSIPLYQGTAKQTMARQSLTLTLGYIFPVSKHNPLFELGWPHRKEIKHPKPMYHTEEDY